MKNWPLLNSKKKLDFPNKMNIEYSDVISIKVWKNRFM